MLNEGDKAPSFILEDQQNKQVKLSDFLGQKVLLYFYPKASTPGCTIQACELRDHITEFEHLHIKVIGISPDPSKKLLNFANKQNLNFTLLSDVNHKTCENYGVWKLKKFMGKEYMGVVRTSFLIDEEGHINHVFDKFKTKDHHSIVLNFINSHQL